jgi:hypothetical protein
MGEFFQSTHKSRVFQGFPDSHTFRKRDIVSPHLLCYVLMQVSYRVAPDGEDRINVIDY